MQRISLDKSLKSIVKDHAQQTQHRVNVFAGQCADQEFESMVLEHAYNDIKHQFGQSLKLPSYSNNLRGMHVVTFGKCNKHGVGDVVVKWKDKTVIHSYTR